MEEKNKKAFLGTGWSFPPAFPEVDHHVEMVSEIEDIKQSIFLLLSTTPGERIMKPRYGCDLQQLVFERMNSSTEGRIVDMVSTALLQYEPRIDLEEIRVEMDHSGLGRIDIYIEFRVRITNSRDNIVYPFYLKEGTNVHIM